MTSAVRDFVNSITDAAEDLAIFEAGKPDNETLARLRRLGVKLQADLTPVIGAATAARMVDAFCGTVMGGKHEREALAAMNLLKL